MKYYREWDWKEVFVTSVLILTFASLFMLLALLPGCSMRMLGGAAQDCEAIKSAFSNYNARCSKHWSNGMPNECSSVEYVRCDASSCQSDLAGLGCEQTAYPPTCDCHYVSLSDGE